MLPLHMLFKFRLSIRMNTLGTGPIQKCDVLQRIEFIQTFDRRLTGPYLEIFRRGGFFFTQHKFFHEIREKFARSLFISLANLNG